MAQNYYAIYDTELEKNTYEQIKEMENYYYGHDYDSEVLNKRLVRLENTSFRYERTDLTYKKRFKDLYDKFKSKNSPFYSLNQKEQGLSRNEINLLRLLETRFYGSEKDNLSYDERLGNLEKTIFGARSTGTLENRFNYISHNTPINVKGIRVTKNGQTIAAMKPGYKSAPLPQCNIINEVYSPIDFEYSPTTGDYYSNVVKNSNNEILHWKDFPIYVYINSKDPFEINNSKMAIDYWQNKVPIRETTELKSANIIIDWASKGRYITTPIIDSSNNDREIKVLINLGNFTSFSNDNEMTIYIMHQLGHAMGIWGHSTDPRDLMYPIGELGMKDINVSNTDKFVYQPVLFKNKSPNISERDLNTLYRIYKTPTSISRILSTF